MNIVDEIIKLKKEVGIQEENATPELSREWYTYALRNGHVETVVRDNKLLGFVEWVRLKEVPKDIYNWTHLVDWKTAKTAPIVFIMNMCTRAKVLGKLRQKMYDSNKDYKMAVWHNKKKGRMLCLNF